MDEISGTVCGSRSEIRSVQLVRKRYRAGSEGSYFPNSGLRRREDCSEGVLELYARFGNSKALERIDSEVVASVPRFGNAFLNYLERVGCGIHVCESRAGTGLDGGGHTLVID